MAILCRFREYNRKLKAKKCSLFQRKVNFLEHIVSENGIECDPGKIEKIRYLQAPQTKTDVRAFIGIGNSFPNGTGQKCDSYRGIALIALCTKVFEYVILNMYSDSLISNNLQFAYKAGTSTTQCTWAAREVISYYNNKGSDVYCCLLDCNKAFDQIKHNKLL